MSATAKFYTGLAIVVALIVAVSYYAGYRAGSHAAVAVRAAHAVPPKIHASP